MALSSDDTRTINPFLPSLFHLGLVRVALSLRTSFGTAMLERASAEIQRENSADSNEISQENLKVGRNEAKEQGTETQHGHSTASDESSRDNCNRKPQRPEIQQRHSTESDESSQEDCRVKCNRAKESLLLLPGSLRKRVLQTVNGMDYAVGTWRMDHLFVGKKERITFRWRSDGTIDRIETARQLVRDESIDVKKRFWTSCVYCFEERVLSLWAEMEASGKTKDIKADGDALLRFWVRWIRKKQRTPFSQAAVEYMDLPRQFSRNSIINFSSFLPLLESEDRQRFLNSLRHITNEDFRVSLYIATELDRQKILKKYAMKLLIIYLNWPFQSLFIETAEKTWNLIDKSNFKTLANLILLYHRLRKDYDYGKLFEDFWNSSPDHFKEATSFNRHLRSRIDLCLEERRKEKANNERLKEILSKHQLE